LISWWFARKIEVPAVKISWKESFSETSGMVRLGAAMMWTGLLGSGATYVTNILITQLINVQAVGVYSAAFALSGMFVNFVLGAMGADYYPRLAGVADDNVAINHLVNEQTEIGLLLVAPGLMATIALAPWLVHIFYSQEFISAVNLLQWLVLGCLGRVISWPLGFVILALNKGKWLFIAETAAQSLNLLLAYLGLYFYGLEGIGIGFCILYVLHIFAMFYVVKTLTIFYWSQSTKKLIIIVSILMVMAFCVARFLPPIPSVVLGLFIVFFGLTISLRGLLYRLGDSHSMVKKILLVPGMKSLNSMNFKFF